MLLIGILEVALVGGEARGHSGMAIQTREKSLIRRVVIHAMSEERDHCLEANHQVTLQEKPMPRRSDTQKLSIVIDREINTRRMRQCRRVGRLVHCKSTGEVRLTRNINIPPMRCPGIIQGAKNCATNRVNTEAINQVSEGIENYWIYQYSNF